MNQPVFLKPIKSENVFKVSDKIKSLNAQQLPIKKIFIKQYHCKKNIKAIGAKKSQNYSLYIIQDGSFAFLSLNQLGSYKSPMETLTDRQFIQQNFLAHLVNQMKQKSSKQYQITGFKWEGFLIQFLALSEEFFLLIITNEYTSCYFKMNEEVNFRIKQSFEQILAKMISQKQAPKKIESYADQIKQLIYRRKQLVTQIPQGKIVNFNLIKYGRIIELIIKDPKSRVQMEKKQYSPIKMELQK